MSKKKRDREKEGALAAADIEVIATRLYELGARKPEDAMRWVVGMRRAAAKLQDEFSPAPSTTRRRGLCEAEQSVHLPRWR